VGGVYEHHDEILFLFRPTNAQIYITRVSLNTSYNVHSYMFRHLCHPQGVPHMHLAKLHIPKIRLKYINILFGHHLVIQ
jgi:hypothetical protein